MSPGAGGGRCVLFKPLLLLLLFFSQSMHPDSRCVLPLIGKSVSNEGSYWTIQLTTWNVTWWWWWSLLLPLLCSFNCCCSWQESCAPLSSNASCRCSSLLFGNLWKWRPLIGWYFDSGIVTTNSASDRCSQGESADGLLSLASQSFSTLFLLLPSLTKLSWYNSWPFTLILVGPTKLQMQRPAGGGNQLIGCLAGQSFKTLVTLANCWKIYMI